MHAVGLSPIHVWGMTETSGAGTVATPDSLAPAGSLGVPFPYVDLRVMATDEREALLWQKAGRQAFWVVVPGLVLAALAAGYWSATVCMTLLGAALFTAVTTKALRFYYMRKF